jgi:hypothetical protein
MALRLFYSKVWQHRVKGIKMMGDELASLPGISIEVVVRYCTILKGRIAEQRLPIFEAALESFQKVCNSHHVQDANLIRCFLEFKDVFMPKLYSYRSQSGKIIVDFLVWLHENGCWEILVNILEQPLQRPTEWPLAKYQLDTFIEIAMRNPSVPLTSLPGAELPILMGFLKPHCTSPNDLVKGAALGLIVILDTSHRESVRDIINGWDVSVQKIIYKALNPAQEGKKSK